VKGHTYKRCPCAPQKDAMQARRVNCRKKHGTWWYVHELPPGPDGRRRQAKRGGFVTEAQASEALTKALEQVRTGTYIERSRVTVAEYLDEWLAGKTKLRPNSRKSYGEHIRMYFKPAFGHIRLTDLRENHIEALYAAMRLIGTDDADPDDPLQRRLLEERTSKVRPLSDASIKRAHATLMSALNTAVKRRRLEVNRAFFVEVPTGRRPKAVVWTDERVERWKATGERPAVAVWTAEQTGRFLDAALAHERLYPIYHLIAYRGLRRGEAVGAARRELSLKDGTLRITQALVQVGWELQVSDPKTDGSERTVSLDAGSISVLKRWIAIQDAEREVLGSAWQDTGLLFTREDGSAVHPDAVTVAFHRIAEEAGLPPIRLHDLRHTAASLALQAGVAMKVVSEQLGHSALAITADTYTSVLPEVSAAAAEAVAGVVPRARQEGVNTPPFTFRATEACRGGAREREPAGQGWCAVRDSNPEPADSGPVAFDGSCHPSNPLPRNRLMPILLSVGACCSSTKSVPKVSLPEVASQSLPRTDGADPANSTTLAPRAGRWRWLVVEFGGGAADVSGVDPVRPQPDAGGFPGDLDGFAGPGGGDGGHVGVAAVVPTQPCEHRQAGRLGPADRALRDGASDARHGRHTDLLNPLRTRLDVPGPNGLDPPPPYRQTRTGVRSNV
jgi:integrase